ncbi:class I SAM-dependent methyltransferase [Candidatus Gottesmanbacteria bacterium]|nr:class I SAM-dependent methyltransferase [Candidatus Gottesmanbacteria bacterium]
MSKWQYLLLFIGRLPPAEKILALLRFFILDVDTIDNNLSSSGIIYDVGCSTGLLTYYLARKTNRSLIGIDINAKRIEWARQPLAGLSRNIQFVSGDVFDVTFPKISGAVLSDFLHHTAFDRQQELLKNLYKTLFSDKTIIIKEIDNDEFVRKWLSRFWDFILYPKDRIYYRSRQEWKELLTSIGFSVSVRSAVRWFPASTTLFICKKNNDKKK